MCAATVGANLSVYSVVISVLGRFSMVFVEFFDKQKLDLCEKGGDFLERTC